MRRIWPTVPGVTASRIAAAARTPRTQQPLHRSSVASYQARTSGTPSSADLRSGQRSLSAVPSAASRSRRYTPPGTRGPMPGRELALVGDRIAHAVFRIALCPSRSWGRGAASGDLQSMQHARPYAPLRDAQLPPAGGGFQLGTNLSRDEIRLPWQARQICRRADPVPSRHRSATACRSPAAARWPTFHNQSSPLIASPRTHLGAPSPSTLMAAVPGAAAQSPPPRCRAVCAPARAAHHSAPPRVSSSR